MGSTSSAPTLIKLNDSVPGWVKPPTLPYRETRSWTTMDYECRFPRRIATQLPVDEITIASVEQPLIKWV